MTNVLLQKALTALFTVKISFLPSKVAHQNSMCQLLLVTNFVSVNEHRAEVFTQAAKEKVHRKLVKELEMYK